MPSAATRSARPSLTKIELTLMSGGLRERVEQRLNQARLAGGVQVHFLRVCGHRHRKDQQRRTVPGEASPLNDASYVLTPRLARRRTLTRARCGNIEQMRGIHEHARVVANRERVARSGTCATSRRSSTRSCTSVTSPTQVTPVTTARTPEPSAWRPRCWGRMQTIAGPGLRARRSAEVSKWRHGAHRSRRRPAIVLTAPKLHAICGEQGRR